MSLGVAQAPKTSRSSELSRKTDHEDSWEDIRGVGGTNKTKDRPGESEWGTKPDDRSVGSAVFEFNILMTA